MYVKTRLEQNHQIQINDFDGEIVIVCFVLKNVKFRCCAIFTFVLHTKIAYATILYTQTYSNSQYVLATQPNTKSAH